MVTAATSIPRHQQGAHSQQLLTVLYGDYWFRRPELIPSGALVELLGIFDVTEAGARAAIRRLAQRGFLQGERSGRSTAYGVDTHVHGELVERIAALFMGGSGASWDGRWTIVAYSLPETARNARNALRDQLRRHGFGNLYDGLWLRPGDSSAQVEEIRTAIEPPLRRADVTCFVSAELPDGADAAELASRAFQLPEVAAGYRAFIDEWSPLADERRAASAEGGTSTYSDAQALRVRTSVMRQWRELRREDPRLPAELLGAQHPLEEAAALSAFLYDDLGPQAVRAFRQVLEHHDPVLAPLAARHRFHELAGLAD